MMLVIGNYDLLLSPGKVKNLFLIFTFLSELFWALKAHTDDITLKMALEVHFNVIP